MITIDQYIEAKSNAEPAVLRELVRQTHLRVTQPRMLSGAVQGELLAMIVRMLQPHRVLEFGTFTGYSTIAMAMALGDGAKIITMEIDDELEAIASEFIARAGVRGKVEQLFGEALELIEQIEGEVFDLVFIDADKREYLQYYNRLFELNLVSIGSVILVDNTLWSGKVLLEIDDHKDNQTKEIKVFNDFVSEDERVDKVILPLRDGLTVIRVK